MPENVLKAIITADTTGFNRNIDAATGSIEELKQVSKSLKAEISGLDTSLRNSKGGKALQNELRSVNTELKSLEKQAGISGAATGNALTKGFSGVRQLAYLLPGIGLAGIFNLAFEGLEKFVNGLSRLGNAFNPVKELQSVLEGAEKSFVKASVEVDTLRINIDLAKKGFLSKSAVVKEYNDTIGKTTGFVKTLDEAEKALNDNAENYIKSTLLKAAANLALEKAAKKAFDIEQTRRKQLEDFSNAAVDSRTSSGGAGGFGTGAFNAREFDAETKRIEAARIERKNKAIQIDQDALKGFEDIARDLLKQSADLTKGFTINPDASEAKKFKDFINDTISQAKRLADFLNNTTIRSFRFEVDPRDSLKTTFDRAREFIKKSEGPRSAFAFKINAFVQIDKDSPELFKNLPKETEDIRKKAEKLIEDLASRNQIVIAVELKQLELRNAQRRLLALSQELVNTIRNTVGNAFVSLAETIGGAFSGIDLGGQIFAIIGDLISQIGKALIQFGIVKLGLDKLLKSPLALSGGAAIALGAAAVAIGSLVKNIRVKGQRAVGGFVNSGDAYLVGERGPELFRPNVSGNIVANNAIAGARGTQMPMQISGDFRLQGNDLVAAIANTNRSQGRLN